MSEYTTRGGGTGERKLTGGALRGLGGTKHLAPFRHGVEPFPHHAAHGAAGHVLDEPGEEALARQVLVVGAEELGGRVHELERHQPEWKTHRNE